MVLHLEPAIRGGFNVGIAPVACLYETDNALLCSIDGESVWVPRSSLREGNEIHMSGDYGTLVVSKWYAENVLIEIVEDEEGNEAYSIASAHVSDE